MNFITSEFASYYLLLFFFTILFVLQIWALIRIKKMIRHILEIYQKLEQSRAAVPAAARGKRREPPRICQNCRYRETFLTPAGNATFVYRCALHQQKIRLSDFCSKFEMDAQNADI